MSKPDMDAITILAKAFPDDEVRILRVKGDTLYHCGVIFNVHKAKRYKGLKCELPLYDFEERIVKPLKVMVEATKRDTGKVTMERLNKGDTIGSGKDRIVI